MCIRDSGDDDLRLLGIEFDLRAQALHVHVHQPGVAGVTVAPDLLQQDLPGEEGALQPVPARGRPETEHDGLGDGDVAVGSHLSDDVEAVEGVR